MFAPVRLSLGFSRTLFVLLCTIHLIALLSALSLSLDLYIRVILAAAILLSCAYNVRKHCFRTLNRSVRAVLLKPENLHPKAAQLPRSTLPADAWRLELVSDQSSLKSNQPAQQQAATLAGSYLVTPWLVLLSFKVEGRWGRFPVVIFADSTDSAQFRQLRILLLH